MLLSVQLKRLTAATLVCAALVLGISVLIGSGRAQANAAGPAHTCSVTDKQFLQTARDNMTQLQYWSDELRSDDVSPAVVIKQAGAEARQVEATRPDDLSLKAAQNLLRGMFLEYAAAVRGSIHGGNAGVHVYNAYSLANSAHDVLVEAQVGLADKGCDVTPLLQA